MTEARQAVENGKQVDLSGLEREVDEICAQLGGVPPGAAANIRLMLVVLMDDLERLTASLTSAHQKLTSEIGSLKTRRRATKAYGHQQD